MKKSILKKCIAEYSAIESAKDFCAPEFDKEHREIQLDKVRQYMTPIFESEV